MDRMAQIAAWLPEGADAALVMTPVSRLYLTGFESSDGILLVTRSEAVLAVDGRYVEAARQKASGCQVVHQSPQPGWLLQWLKGKGIGSLLLEAAVTVEQFDRMQKSLNGIKLCADGALDQKLREMRAVKSPREIALIEQAQRLAEEAFERILGDIRPGRTEREIAARLEYEMRRLGSERESFETIVVSGKKSSMPHGVPDGKEVEPGDLVTLDFGAVVGGYHSDMTRTVAVRQVGEEQKEVYSVVLQAQNKALEALKPGLLLSEGDAAARAVIEQAGYGRYFDHSTGHGVGLEIHEAPNLSPRGKGVLRENQVVTVEPGIYLPGRFGVRIEDFAVVTREGCRNLTQCPKELLVL